MIPQWRVPAVDGPEQKAIVYLVLANIEPIETLPIRNQLMKSESKSGPLYAFYKCRSE